MSGQAKQAGAPAENDPSEDRELVEALQAGDPTAPRRLIERYQGVLFGLCLRMLGHRQDAEDVLQETFLRALRGLHGFQSDRPLRPWLLGIAANRCRTALAKRARQQTSPELLADFADPGPGIRDPDDLAGEIQAAIGRLRESYRLVFVLFHEQGLPYEEIAQAMDRPVGTVKTWLHRARAELADDLSRRGVRC